MEKNVRLPRLILAAEKQVLGFVDAWVPQMLTTD